MQVSSGTTLVEEKERTLSVEGEIPCFIVFSDRKHVDYIYNIVNCVRACLSKRGFKVELLSEETIPDEYFGGRFEKLAEECVLGVVILDGFRPNVLFEYGFLRGKGRIVIPLQDKKAFVAVRSLYSLVEGSDEIIKSCTGLTKVQFAKLKEPSLGYFQNLSDRHGIKAIVVDCGAEFDSCEYPQNKFDHELEKIMPAILKKYREQNLKPVSEVSPSYLVKFHDLVLDISEYYAGTNKFDEGDIDKVVSRMEGLEKDAGSKMPSRVYSMTASLYLSLIEKSDWKDVHKIVSHYERAIGLYTGILNFEKDPVLRSDISKRIGDCHWSASQYKDKVENCRLAIHAYAEALKVYVFDKFPMGYATTQNNLGVAYGTLGEVEDKVENCRLAIKAYNEALKILTEEEFPEPHKLVKRNLERTLILQKQII